MSNQSNVFKRIISKLVFLQKAFSVLMISMLVLLVFAQVLLREMNLPLMGIEELIIFPTIWLYMIGSANASEERTQISVDILEVFLSNPTILTVIDLVNKIVSLIIGIFLTYWLFNFFTYSLNLWKISPLISMPMFFVESALFIGVLLMTLYTLSDLFTSIKNTRDYFTKKKSKGGI